jgi:hypothetical protein
MLEARASKMCIHKLELGNKQKIMLMDNNLFILIGVIVIGMLFLSALFLPRIKIVEENEQISLHTEYCTVTRYIGIFSFGSPFSFLSKRVSFYDNFFVIAGITGKKIYIFRYKISIL